MTFWLLQLSCASTKSICGGLSIPLQRDSVFFEQKRVDLSNKMLFSVGEKGGGLGEEQPGFLANPRTFWQILNPARSIGGFAPLADGRISIFLPFLWLQHIYKIFSVCFTKMYFFVQGQRVPTPITHAEAPRRQNYQYLYFYKWPKTPLLRQTRSDFFVFCFVYYH